MRAVVDKIRHGFDENGKVELTLSLPRDSLTDIQEIKSILANDKKLLVEIKQYRHKRSLDANAYMWVVLSEMAIILHTTKDELYLTMLERYGVFTHVVVKPNVVDRVKEEWRTVRELGEVKINGQTGVQLQCFFGSSTYDTKEMSVLIDGVVSEAKEIGVNTMTPAEIALLKQEWGR